MFANNRGMDTNKLGLVWRAAPLASQIIVDSLMILSWMRGAPHNGFSLLIR
jgi:hypothetical protein